MALIERMKLAQHERTFVVNGVTERVKYVHIIERDGETIQAIPHRIVIDRNDLTQEHPMPDGTIKTTAEIVAEIDG